MSLMRKISQEHRHARSLRRIRLAEAAGQKRMQQIAEALRLGMIKMKPPTLPLTARMVVPREELKLRMGNGDLDAGTAKLVYRGHRVGGEDKPTYEVRTYERKQERNKYAGYYSPGTWLERAA